MSADASNELSCGAVAEITDTRQYPVVQEWTLQEDAVFDPAHEIDGTTVTLYPPGLVIIMRVLNEGRVMICRTGRVLCVIARRHLKLSEVKLS